MAINQKFINCVSERGNTKYLEFSKSDIIFLKSLQIFSDVAIERAPVTVAFFALNKLMIDYPYLGVDPASISENITQTSVFDTVSGNIIFNGKDYEIRDVNPLMNELTPDGSKFVTTNFNEYPLKYLGDEFFASVDKSGKEYLEYSYFGFNDYKGEHIFDVKTTYNYVKHRRTKLEYTSDTEVIAYFYDTISFNLICDKYFRKIGNYKWSIEKNAIVDTEWFITRKDLKEYTNFAVQYFPYFSNYSRFNENSSLIFYAMPKGAAGSVESFPKGCDCECDNCVGVSDTLNEPKLNDDDRIVYEIGEYTPTEEPDNKDKEIIIAIHTLELYIVDPDTIQDSDTTSYDNGCQLYGDWKKIDQKKVEVNIADKNETVIKTITKYYLNYNWNLESPQTFKMSFIGGEFVTKDGRTYKDIPALGRYYVFTGVSNADDANITSDGKYDIFNSPYWKGNLSITVPSPSSLNYLSKEYTIEFGISLNNAIKETPNGDLWYTGSTTSGGSGTDPTPKPTDPAEPTDPPTSSSIFVGGIEVAIYSQQYVANNTGITLMNGGEYSRVDRGNYIDDLKTVKGRRNLNTLIVDGQYVTSINTSINSLDNVSINDYFLINTIYGNVSNTSGDKWMYKIAKMTINGVERNLDTFCINQTDNNAIFKFYYRNFINGSRDNTVDFYFGDILSDNQFSRYELKVLQTNVEIEGEVGKKIDSVEVGIVSTIDGENAEPNISSSLSIISAGYFVNKDGSQKIIITSDFLDNIKTVEGIILLSLDNKEAQINVKLKINPATKGINLTIASPVEIQSVNYKISTSTTLSPIIASNTIYNSEKNDKDEYILNGTMTYSTILSLSIFYVTFYLNITNLENKIPYKSNYLRCLESTSNISLTLSDFKPFAIISVSYSKPFTDCIIYINDTMEKNSTLNKVSMKYFKKVGNSSITGGRNCINDILIWTDKINNYPLYVTADIKVDGTIYSSAFGELISSTAENPKVSIANFGMFNITWDGTSAREI